MLKFNMVVALTAAFVEALQQGASAVILVAGVIAGLAVIWGALRKARRGWRRAKAFFAVAEEAFRALIHLAAWKADVDERLASIESEGEHVRDRLEAIVREFGIGVRRKSRRTA